MKQTFLFFALVWSIGLLGQEADPVHSPWVDSVLQQMSIEERIGQLFMVRAMSTDPSSDRKLAVSQMKKQHVGGFCFFQGDPHEMAQMIEAYQDSSKYPLMTAIDGEWGLGMRFKDQGVSLPRLMTMGAANDGYLSYQSGRMVGKHLREVGIQVNFAPVVDINNNPSNPVIHYRSFGESREEVTYLADRFASGMEDQGVLPCFKHFPGHGDTDIDSHEELPQIHHSRARLDSLELYPYRYVLKPYRSVMIAHLHVPALDTTPDLPATLSPAIVQGILRDSYQFDGLIFTDALEMKALTKRFGPGEAAVRALEAGADILLLPADLSLAVAAVKKAYNAGRLSSRTINNKVHRILRFKERYHRAYRYDSTRVAQVLEDPEANQLKTDIYSKAITVLSSSEHELPLRNLERPLASLSIGGSSESAFQQELSALLDVYALPVPNQLSEPAQTNILSKLKNYDRVVVDVQGMSYRPSRDFGITASVGSFLQKLDKEKELTVFLFGTPYALNEIDSLGSVVVCYEDDPVAQKAAVNALLGVTDYSGELPVHVSEHYPLGAGVRLSSLSRIGIGTPESVHLDSDTLAWIDTIVAEMIAEKATPGCQVLIIKDGVLVWNRSYGYHTYESKTTAQVDHLYDLASLTKVVATTAVIMRLVDNGLVDLDEVLEKYLPECRETELASVTIRELLAHHAGLPGWIPFYRNTLDEDQQLLSQWYGSRPNDSFTVQIHDQLYMHEEYLDSIWHRVYQSELKERGEYRYSDLSFYLLAQVAEKTTGMSLDDYVNEYFFRPLGMTRTHFNPREKVPLSSIVPSEVDDYFRQTEIHGHVHDMGAAMLGGVAGHAGLFSNATDLGIFMQMMLNGGTYAGRDYLSPEIVEIFTRRYEGHSRRGLGFDMKEMDEDKTANMAVEASARTFGHLGFTGTCAWADPKHQLIYVFLSNRTYPTMNNKKLIKGDYRPRIQSVIYRALRYEYE